MHQRSAPTLLRAFLLALTAGLFAGLSPSAAYTEALLLVETDTGKVLHAENATYPWYPASVSKIMTTYTTLRAVKEGRIKLDTMLTVSENAAAQQPSKMGFPPGTQVSVDNALKMLMVKSANDIAVVIAEGVGGSVEGFAAEMNRHSQRLGMTQSTWVNPHGLPADGQVSSARDMAILARAIIREFPQHDIYWKAPAIRFGNRVMRNYNRLIDRYPGADGMKTGFICASGYNLVATATRNGRRLIAVVMGAPSGTARAETAAKLLERGFSGNVLAWLMPALGSVDAMQPIAAAPPNLREEICGPGRRNRTDHAEEEQAQNSKDLGPVAAFASGVFGAQASTNTNGSLLGPPIDSAPLPVSVIPPKGMAAANPEALLYQGRGRKRGKVKVTRGKNKGRQTAVIAVGAGGKDKPAAGAKGAKAKPKAAAPKASAKPKGKPTAPKGAGAKAKSAAAPTNPKR